MLYIIMPLTMVKIITSASLVAYQDERTCKEQSAGAFLSWSKASFSSTTGLTHEHRINCNELPQKIRHMGKICIITHEPCKIKCKYVSDFMQSSHMSLCEFLTVVLHSQVQV